MLGLTGAKPVGAPGSKDLAKTEPERPLDQEQAKLYRSVVCKIMRCQADFISAQFCIKELARDLQQPTDRSMAQLRHLVRYLLGARDLWQVARADRTDDFVTVCVDSNWADGPSRRSTDMVIVKIWDLLLFNSAKTQAFVAQSSAEAELAGIHRGVQMGIFFQNPVKQYGFEVPVRVYSDSSAGIAFAGRQGCGPVRYLEVKQLWVQQRVASGRVCLLQIRC